MTEEISHLSSAELELGQQVIAELNQHNLFCHCRRCNREWIASIHEHCLCGSQNVEVIACWQFPDD